MTVARAADRLGEELLPHVPMCAAQLYTDLARDSFAKRCLWWRRLIVLVKALLGSKPVVVVESKEAKNAKPGEGALDLQNEQKRDDQTKRRRFQQKCLAVVRGFVCLPEASECSALQVRNCTLHCHIAG